MVVLRVIGNVIRRRASVNGKWNLTGNREAVKCGVTTRVMRRGAEGQRVCGNPRTEWL